MGLILREAYMYSTYIQGNLHVYSEGYGMLQFNKIDKIQPNSWLSTWYVTGEKYIVARFRFDFKESLPLPLPQKDC